MLSYDLITDWEWIGELPGNYGWFHLVWLIIMFLACFASVYFLARKHNNKVDDIFVFSLGSFLVLIELYKQIFFAVLNEGYDWSVFPFQLCSMPIYVAFIAPLIKNEKIKDGMYRFLASFCLLAGTFVMLYPNTCLNTPYVTMLIHTMVWHSTMVVIGVYLIFAKNYGKNLKELIIPSFMFAIFSSIAVGLNCLFYLNNKDVYFNMFYLSPYYYTPIEILTEIKDSLGIGVYFFIYVLGICVICSLVWLLIIGLRKLLNKNKSLV